MAKRLTYNIITGNDPHLGMCFYYSPHFNQNVWRRSSSLTGERTKKDPAFKGFRQSSSRLKQASPIAASLYKILPGEVKQYALYRTLTGEAIKMLKEGMEVAGIRETLKKKYIDPLLGAPETGTEHRTIEEPSTREHFKDLRDFNSYLQNPSVLKITPGIRRALLHKKIKEGRSDAGYFTSVESNPIPQPGRNVSAFPPHEPELREKSKPRIKTTDGLTYLGRLPECKKLKVWLRPVDSAAADSIIG